jgi:hypothetical protein
MLAKFAGFLLLLLAFGAVKANADTVSSVPSVIRRKPTYLCFFQNGVGTNLCTRCDMIC